METAHAYLHSADEPIPEAHHQVGEVRARVILSPLSRIGEHFVRQVDLLEDELRLRAQAARREPRVGSHGVPRRELSPTRRS